MAIIAKAFSEVDDTIAEASSINRVIDDLYTLQAGNIDNSNIAPSGINSSNYSLSSVYTDALQDMAVTNNKADGSIFLTVEVFS